jgi:Ca-activated chloride channel family protein
MNRPSATKKSSALLLMGALMLMQLLVGGLAPARADGLLVVEGVYRQPAISHITVTIENKIASTVVEQTFRNPLDKEVLAVYAAPVPPGATITSFSQLIDGVWQEAEVQTSAEANKQFATAVASGEQAAITSGSVKNNANKEIDPTLTFQTRLNLPPASERKVRLTYTEVLTGQAGLTRYVYPLNSSALTDEPVGDLLVSVKIVEKSEIRAVYSPSHDSAEIARPDDLHANAVYRAQNVNPAQDFELVYTQSADKFGVNMASYLEKDGDDGYFVLIAAPQLKIEQKEVVQKDFVFVLDRSGSMAGEKFEQARKALLRILDNLNEGDRFTVLAFDEAVQNFTGSLVELKQRDQAKQWASRQSTGSGTNISDALLAGLRTVDQASTRPHIIVFLTDGQATNGITDTAGILTAVREQIRPQSRLYTVGIGDVNQPLLESLAAENRGRFLYLTTDEPLEKPISGYYASIDNPVLVDLELDFGGIEVYDVQPNPVPDMFLGGQVVITGRYKGSGKTTITLKGNINGQPHVSTYKDVEFLGKAADAKTNGYVPRLWAQQKADSLVRTIAINGPTPELIKEVTDLGLRYKIVTPYTAFVVTDKSKNPKVQPTQPSLPGAGLSFLYVDEYRTLNTALMVAGAALLLIGVVGIAGSWVKRLWQR